MDPATGLRDHRIRFTTGNQWLQEDPWGLAPDVNPRRYVGNGPTNFTDPSGLAGVTIDTLPGDAGADGSSNPGGPSAPSTSTPGGGTANPATNGPPQSGSAPAAPAESLAARRQRLMAELARIEAILSTTTIHSVHEAYDAQAAKLRALIAEIDRFYRLAGVPSGLDGLTPSSPAPPGGSSVVVVNGIRIDMGRNGCTGGSGLGPVVRPVGPPADGSGMSTSEVAWMILGFLDPTPVTGTIDGAEMIEEGQPVLGSVVIGVSFFPVIGPKVGKAIKAASRSASKLDAAATAKFRNNLDEILGRTPNAPAPRPIIKSPPGADPRVTHALPPNQSRTPPEVAEARQFYKNHQDQAKKWWEERTGQKWPDNATHCEHPRSLAEGGDPLFIEPGFGGPTSPHMIRGKDGLTDFQRWGSQGGNATAGNKK